MLFSGLTPTSHASRPPPWKLCQDCESRVGFVCFLNSLGLGGLGYHSLVLEACLGAKDGTESACNAGDLGSIPRSGRSPGEGTGLLTPVSLPGKSHGQGSLVGYSPWGRKESDMTERLTHTFNGIVESCLFTQECFQNSEAEVHHWEPRQKGSARPSSGLLWSLLEDDFPAKRRRLKEKKRRGPL